MKQIPLLFLAVSLYAQAPPAAGIQSTDVVATVDGKPLTAGDVAKIVDELPPQMRANYNRDPKGFLDQWFLLLRLSSMAEDAKLAEQSPFKEALRVNRMNVLAQALLEEKSKHIEVLPEDQKKYFEANKDNYTQAKLKVIYIPFTDKKPEAPSKKPVLNEAEAKAKAAEVAKKARAGEDFVKLVKTNSEEPTSAEKDGDFGTMKRSDKMPEDVKTVIFSMKKGDISDPVRQPNGFYIFRLEDLIAGSYDEVKDGILVEIKNQRFRQWMEETSKSLQLQVQKPAFFSPAGQPRQ
jgi:peptidyl-prolyl cis-trans isomerase C